MIKINLINLNFKLTSLLLASVLLLFSSSTFSFELPFSQSKNSLQKRIKEHQSLQEQEKKQLQKMEAKILELKKNLDELILNIKTQEKEQQLLETKQKTLQGQILKHESFLLTHLKILHRLPQSSGLKLFLSNQNPHAVTRLFKYHLLLKKYLVQSLEQAKIEFFTLETQTQELLLKTQALKTLKERKSIVYQSLLNNKKSQEKFITQLKQTIDADKNHLEKMAPADLRPKQHAGHKPKNQSSS